MPKNLTDVDAFTSPVAVPVDSDTANAASVETGFQALSDRTRYVYNVLNNEEWVTSPASRYLVLAAAGLFAGQNGWQSASAGFASIALSTVDNAGAHLTLNRVLPSDAVLDRVDVLVNPGAARASGSNMSVSLWEMPAYDFGSPPAAPTGNLLADVEDDTTTALQVITLSGLAYTLDSQTDGLVLSVHAGATAGASPDHVHALRFIYTDVGPRNY